MWLVFFFVKQKTAYEMRISDWSSDVCSSDLSSWGAARLPDSAGPLDASAFSGRFFGAAPQRLLGPVEYLTVWHLQRTQRTALGADTFHTPLSRLIALLTRSDDARTLYPQKLAAAAQNEPDARQSVA